MSSHSRKLELANIKKRVVGSVLMAQKLINSLKKVKSSTSITSSMTLVTMRFWFHEQILHSPLPFCIVNMNLCFKYVKLL